MWNYVIQPYYLGGEGMMCMMFDYGICLEHVEEMQMCHVKMLIYYCLLLSSSDSVVRVKMVCDDESAYINVVRDYLQ